MEGDKIQTHINGFDELLDGGIPKGHIVLLAGPPGTMKSSIAYNVLHGNANVNKIRGAYISLEQSEASLLRQMDGLGLKHEDVKDYISIIDMAFMRKKLAQMHADDNLLDLFKLHAKNLRDEERYEILVVDSLSVLKIIAQFKNSRNELFQFFEWLRSLKTTVLLVSESPRDPNKVCDEEFLADGVIHIFKERVGTVDTQLRIIIDKMRETGHHRGYFNLAFKDKRFQISQIISI